MKAVLVRSQDHKGRNNGGVEGVREEVTDPVPPPSKLTPLVVNEPPDDIVPLEPPVSV